MTAPQTFQVPVTLYFEITPGFQQTGEETPPAFTTNETITLLLQQSLKGFAEGIESSLYTVNSVAVAPRPS